MIPITQEELYRYFFSGLLQGLWIGLKAAWPYIAAIVGIKYVFRLFRRKRRS